MDAQQRAALKSRLADVHGSFEQAEQSIVLRHTCRMEQPSVDTPQPGHGAGGRHRGQVAGYVQSGLGHPDTWDSRPRGGIDGIERMRLVRDDIAGRVDTLRSQLHNM